MTESVRELLRRPWRTVAGRFWRPERGERNPETFWMAHPEVRRRINRRITGDPDLWPIDWLRANVVTEPLGRVVVPGCGTGELERDLVTKGLCRRVLAFDLSPRQVAEARERARHAGVADAIDYRTAAMEELHLPEATFDGCFFHHALHHAEDPEGLLRKLRRALRPGALLYLDEYVGPSRRQWNRRSYAAAVDAYRRLPAPVRRHRRLRIPGLLAKLSDPSESIASDRIVPAVEELFEVRHRRDYGGFLLHPLWQQIHHPPEVVARLIEEEEEQIGDHPTWYAVIVARVSQDPPDAPGRGSGTRRGAAG